MKFMRWVPRLLAAVSVLHLAYGAVMLGVPTSLHTEAQVSAFWFLITGVAWLSQAHLAMWTVRRTGTLPALVGWWLVATSVPGVILMPASGFWLALAVGLSALAASRKAANR